MLGKNAAFRLTSGSAAAVPLVGLNRALLFEVEDKMMMGFLFFVEHVVLVEKRYR